MAYPIDRKLVISVASSALFDLSESHQIYLTQGVDEYCIHQEKNIDNPFPKGVAFPFIRRFLGINKAFPKQLPVEVVLPSRNSPETGLRVFRSTRNYGLDITLAAFITGRSPHKHVYLGSTHRVFLRLTKMIFRKPSIKTVPPGVKHCLIFAMFDIRFYWFTHK